MNYVPLTLRLSGFWDSVRADLPESIQSVVHEHFRAPPWDVLSPEQRRAAAEQYDYRNDPKYEAVTYFELSQLADDLVLWIGEARQQSEHSAALKLSDIAGRIDRILSVDRERVGADIQALRRSHENPAGDGVARGQGA
ncbi:MAG: hypothetical protein M3O62_19830, partial [Pseudomonadota bacterium]|nr:hypothetical protein [Pseudomonadota bacterium]